jgi:putative DNA primase/helicase
MSGSRSGAVTLSDTIAAVKCDGGRRMARCPAHDDRRASLSVARGRDGRILLHCHANTACTFERIVEAAGIDPRELAPPDHHDRRGGDVVATYDYRDEAGRLLYQVLRFEPKRFLQRRPDGNGGWIWSLEGTRRVLYHLDQLHQRRPKTVFVCEGEKDVDRLAVLDLPATTNPHGAGKWRAEYAEQLRAAGVERVVVLPDADPPGERHAEQVAQSCHQAGLAVKVVTLPDVPPKGDVSDWLADGHAKDELLDLAQKAPLWTPIAPAARPDGARPTRLAITRRASEIEPQPIDWLWHQRLARGKLQIIAGDPGVGKSYVTLDFAARISTGSHWPDGTPAPAGGVVILSAEDGAEDTIIPRLERLGADRERITLIEGVKDGDIERGFSLTRDADLLEAEIRKNGAVLAIIDPISAYFGTSADSYKDTDVRSVLRPFAEVASRTGAAIIATMHLTKSADRRAIARAQGSIAFTAAARIVLAVARDPDDPQRRILVPVKSNLAADAPALAYRIDETHGLLWEPVPVEGAVADRLLAPPSLEEQAERREVDEWLRERLAEGPVDTRQIQADARRAGFAWRTVWRAKVRLGVSSTKSGFKDGWAWSLGTAAKDATFSPLRSEVASFGETGQIPRRMPKDATSTTVASFGGGVASFGSPSVKPEPDPVPDHGDGAAVPLPPASSPPVQGDPALVAEALDIPIVADFVEVLSRLDPTSRFTVEDARAPDPAPITAEGSSRSPRRQTPRENAARASAEPGRLFGGRDEW